MSYCFKRATALFLFVIAFVSLSAFAPRHVSAAGSGPVGKQMLWAKSGPGIGEVTIYWQHADSANNYHLVYGTEPGKAEYGALNIGRVEQFNIRLLSPGKKYYIALVPTFNGRALYTTPWVMATAGGAVATVQNTTPSVSTTPPATTITPQTQVMESEEETMMEGESQSFTGSAKRVGAPAAQTVEEKETMFYDETGQRKPASEQSFRGSAQSLSDPTDSDPPGYYTEDGVFHRL